MPVCEALASKSVKVLAGHGRPRRRGGGRPETRCLADLRACAGHGERQRHRTSRRSSTTGTTIAGSRLAVVTSGDRAVALARCCAVREADLGVPRAFGGHGLDHDRSEQSATPGHGQDRRRNAVLPRSARSWSGQRPWLPRRWLTRDRRHRHGGDRPGGVQRRPAGASRRADRPDATGFRRVQRGGGPRRGGESRCGIRPWSRLGLMVIYPEPVAMTVVVVSSPHGLRSSGESQRVGSARPAPGAGHEPDGQHPTQGRTAGLPAPGRPVRAAQGPVAVNVRRATAVVLVAALVAAACSSGTSSSTKNTTGGGLGSPGNCLVIDMTVSSEKTRPDERPGQAVQRLEGRDGQRPLRVRATPDQGVRRGHDPSGHELGRGQ